MLLKRRHRSGLYTTRKLALAGWAFTLPFLIFFFVFTILPVLDAVRLSFTDHDLVSPGSFVGFKNYFDLFTDDDVFVIALKNTLVFALIVGPTGLLLSFLFAWIISQMRFKTGLALAFYAPSITSSIALSSVWLYFFSSDRYGFFNQLLYSLGLISSPILWTTDPQYILTVVMIISLWMSMGTGFLTFLAGLQNISEELYEAGDIDGVRNKFQQLIYITLPSMRPQLLFGVINAVASSFGTFDIGVAVAGIPSPDYAAHTLVTHLYDHAFLQFEMGYASAVAVFLFVLTYLIGRLFMRVLASDD